MHKPLKVIYKAHFQSKKRAFHDEQRKTVELMSEFGIRKVRGADALCTRSWCYQKNKLFWVPNELRQKAEKGLLGKLDPPVGDF